MSESEGLELNGGKLQDFTIDQMAGALALSLGAVGTLLLVIWQSRCACKCRLGFSDKCYICELVYYKLKRKYGFYKIIIILDYKWLKDIITRHNKK